jgi:hypothetical protein
MVADSKGPTQRDGGKETPHLGLVDGGARPSAIPTGVITLSRVP